jgi:hypothetical protein
MKLFDSKPDDVPTIRQKLRDAEAEIEALEREMDECASESVQTGDYQAAELLTKQIAAAHLRVQVLTRAEAAAIRAEEARLAELRQKEARARTRALRAHLANLQNASAAYERAVAQMVQAWKSVTTAAGSAFAICRNEELQEHKLRRAAEVEIFRQGAVPTNLGDAPDAPGSAPGQSWSNKNPAMNLPTFGEEISKLSAFVLGEVPPKLDTPASPAFQNTLTPGSADWYAAPAAQKLVVTDAR